MKERISGVFKSKTFYIIFSILLAIAAWLLVVSSRNPSESRALEVPITFVNRNVLAENDLVDNSPTTQPTKVTVKVSGSEAFIGKLQPSDIYVEVDYREVTKPGEVTVKIKKPVCEMLGVTVDSYYPTEIDCVYDKKIEKYIDVAVDWDASLSAEGVAVVDTVSEPSSILVTGFSMLLDQIDSVRANLADAVKPGSITQSGSANLVCRFYNAAGDDISYNFDTEKVTVKYTTGKVVPVRYSITGNPGDDCYIVSHSPSTPTLILTGSTDALSSISSLDLGEIDVQGAKNTFSREISIGKLLPDGVSAHGTETVKITVNIESYISRELAVSTAGLKKTGEKGEYIYQYEMSRSGITVKGPASVVNRLTDGALTYSVDVSDLSPGSHEKEVRFDLPADVRLQNGCRCSIRVAGRTTPQPSQPSQSRQPSQPIQPSPTPTAQPSPTPAPSPTETPTAPAPTETPTP